MSWQSGDPEARPTVYLPQSDEATPLAYETYADPAEAHGWRKAYADGDDTSVLPVVPGGPAGRQERRSRRRPTSRGKLARRLAVAGGAAGVVALGIAVSGVFDSGAAGGAGGTPQGTTRPVHLPTGPAQEDDDSTAAASAQPLQAPPATTSAATPSPGTSASTPGNASTPPASGAPTASATTSPSAAPTASATSTPGRRGHGHGHGGWSE
uniref:Serine/threonine protein kinase n=1 Tax=Streptomyces sp. NBC_01393 TaxID=2903851 RepID=A0AAU3I8L0_9ACTN